ncbi:MAG: hypothetical protein K0R71_1760 [Bacillales bacterium]|jgi:polyisoprenoid-binding protein YceI|nr:hypothetical protein [Bacillales bacterium]
MTIKAWTLDNAHSSVDFSVKHMMISKVKGSFKDFTATIVADPEDLTTAEIEFEVQMASIDTRNLDRDNHLRTNDFFEVEAHPTMKFVAIRIEKTDDGEYNVFGNLTIKGVTRAEVFTATFEGTGQDPWGQTKVGFTVEGKVNRSDYGIVYNAALETGGVLIGDQVKISLDVQAVIT